MALGAERRDVLCLVLRETMLLVMTGIAIATILETRIRCRPCATSDALNSLGSFQNPLVILLGVNHALDSDPVV